MQPINLRSFAQKVRYHKKSFKKYLSKLEKFPVKNINAIVDKVDAEVWQEIDCLTCANCCKKMTPTFTMKDIKSIATHFEMTPNEVKEKWLHQDEENGDWININQPCQFLNMQTNICSIYEVRPADCSGFPYLKKKKVTDYIHVHQQNIEYCPATFKMVEKWMTQMPK